MVWDILLGRRMRRERGKPKDEVDVMIDIIERFAPKQYRTERETFFYNYKIMNIYLKALLPLLETISRKERLKSDPSAFARDMFLKLKDFYDPKNRLSFAEAMEDSGMIKKYREVFLFFYGKREYLSSDIKNLVKDN